MENITITPISRVDGTINLPGSKSISNRVLLVASLAHGVTCIKNLLDSDDTRHMLNALTSLNITYDLSSKRTTCIVNGGGGTFEVAKPTQLFLGNSGTALRPLCAALCLGSGTFTLTGEPRMEERPIGNLVDVLRQAGGDVHYLKKEGHPPIVITGTGLRGGEVHMDGSISSQFLSAYLIAAPMADNDTVIRIKGDLVSKPYVEITLEIMKQFGVTVKHENYRTFFIKGNQIYQSPGEFQVEGDGSSASYFLAAGAIKGGVVRVTGIGRKSIQGDIHFAHVLEKMGAHITWRDDYIEASSGELESVDMDMNHIPDAAMTVAVTALFAKGTTCIRNIHSWRFKETDRLSAMATELRKVGAEVEEGNDYIKISPPQTLQSAVINTYNDHRMAMCFSLIALGGVTITINDPGCTSKTFPGYFKSFSSICDRHR